MAGPSLLCCLFLLLGGVFGDTDEVTVSVMKGDSLTLHIKPGETQRTDRLWWTFNSEETAIVFLDKETNETINDDTRFKDRLQVDAVSGSLTITNSRTTDSGVYKLKISRLSGGSIYKRFRVTVSEVITVPEGDSVTLQTDVKIQSGDVIEWKLNGIIIADLTGPVHDAGFTNSEVNKQTGDLIITDIRRDQSGDYEMEINSSSLISHRRFSVTVREVITVSVGDSVTLQTGVKIQTHDVIEWKFKGTIIADLTGPVHERFRNSEVKRQTGDLIITDIRGDQSGDYELKINGGRLQKIFSVNVKGQEKSSGVSPAGVAGICVFFLLVMAAVIAAGVIFYRHYQKKLQDKALERAKLNE